MSNLIKQLSIKILDFLRYKISFSQDGEDVALDSFYEGEKNYKGFYVDIGAHHPTRFSNTYLFYKKGWRGINIDPTPGSMRPFKILRRRDVNLEVGIGKEIGNFQFYCFNDPALNTFNPKLAEERNQGKYFIKKVIDIPLKPLNLVLRDLVKADQHIDFFSIDVEGLDLEVLQSNDWDIFKPDYVLVEDYDFSINTTHRSKILDYLTNKGYKPIIVLKRTIIYKSINI